MVTVLAVTFRRWYGWYDPPYLSGGATQCGHCAAFHKEIFPRVKRELVETGAIRMVWRDFPLDQLALTASAVARSLPAAEALSGGMLAYEMNGEPLPAKNGFPLRVIVPGYYGIANVKWLTRIEVRDTRLVNQFMARDYVTVCEVQQDGETVWTETPVGPWNLKSVPGRVTRVGDD